MMAFHFSFPPSNSSNSIKTFSNITWCLFKMEGEGKGKTLVFCEKRMKNKHTRKREWKSGGVVREQCEQKTNPSSTLFEFSWIYLLFFISKNPIWRECHQNLQGDFLSISFLFLCRFQWSKKPSWLMSTFPSVPLSRKRHIEPSFVTFFFVVHHVRRRKVLSRTLFWEIVFDLWDCKRVSGGGVWGVTWRETKIEEENFSMTQHSICLIFFNDDQSHKNLVLSYHSSSDSD